MLLPDSWFGGMVANWSFEHWLHQQMNSLMDLKCAFIVGECWQVGGGTSLERCTFEVIILSFTLFGSWPPWGEHCSLLVLFLCWAQKQWIRGNMNKDLWNQERNEHFFPLSYAYQAFYTVLNIPSNLYIAFHSTPFWGFGCLSNFTSCYLPSFQLW